MPSAAKKPPPRPPPEGERNLTGDDIGRQACGRVSRSRPGADVDRDPGRAAVRFPLQTEAIARSGAHREGGLHEGGIRRERAAVPTAFLPPDELIRTAADAHGDPALLVVVA